MRRPFSLLIVAAAAMLPACSLYAQEASNEFLFCSGSPNEAVVEKADSARVDEYDQGCLSNGCWNCCCPPLWSISAGAAILHRSKPQSSMIIERFDLPSLSWVPAMDASDFNFNWSAGVDVSAIRRIDRCTAIDAVDFRYFGIQDVQANTSMVTNGTWRFPLWSHGYLRNSAIDSSYGSQLHSMEFNVRRQSSFSRLTWLAGFRWIGLDERLDMTVQLLPGGPPAHYAYATRNNLFGGQIGAAATLWDNGGPFHLESTVKAGLYGNAASSWNEFVDSQGQYRLLASNRKNQVAFVGDIGLLAAYHWNDHVALQAGYQLLWIQGVAVAGSQVMVADSTTHGGVFYHGALTSLNFTW